MPFSYVNLANSEETNCGPLSDTICSGILCVENTCLKMVIVRAAVVCDISITSAHFKWASTTIKKDLFMKGPAKSPTPGVQGDSVHSTSY